MGRAIADAVLDWDALDAAEAAAEATVDADQDRQADHSGHADQDRPADQERQADQTRQASKDRREARQRDAEFQPQDTTTPAAPAASQEAQASGNDGLRGVVQWAEKFAQQEKAWQERQQISKTQKQRLQRFKVDLALEAEAERRCKSGGVSSKVGKLGTSLDFEMNGQTENIIDFLNSHLHRLNSKYNKADIDEADAIAFKQRLDSVTFFMNFLLQQPFSFQLPSLQSRRTAKTDALVQSLVGPSGLWTRFLAWVSKTKPSRRAFYLEADDLKRAVRNTMDSMEALLAYAQPASESEARVRHLQKLLRHAYEKLAAFVLPGHVIPSSDEATVQVTLQLFLDPDLFNPANDLPQDPAQASSYRWAQSTVRRVIPASSKWTVNRLRSHLVLDLGFPEDVELNRIVDGSLQHLPSKNLVRKLQGVVVLENASALFPELADTSLSLIAGELIMCEASTWSPIKKLLKATPKMITQLLCELRAGFQEQKFQAEYHALRQKATVGSQVIIDHSLKVQTRVLPNYGFEGSAKGVVEMRKEVDKYIRMYPTRGDAVIQKLMLDTHRALEVGKPLPLLASIDGACAEAARRIMEADVMILLTGAGFSADSGLAVYADVAKVQAYVEKGFAYDNLCQPQLLLQDPALFWGFWGQCHRDYAETPPHDGYEIISKWVDEYFRESVAADMVQAKMAEDPDAAVGGVATTSAPEGVAAPYSVTEHAGAFFVFTSNVDCHHYDWFRASEIRECHGNIELYQCARNCEKSSGKPVWRAPLDLRFLVDKQTMLAPAGPRSSKAQEVSDETASSKKLSAPAVEAHVGQVRGGGRPRRLQYMPNAEERVSARGFASNHPICVACGGPARPAIHMFHDSQWQDVGSQANRWNTWTRSALRFAGGGVPLVGKPGNRQARVVLLEIGAGDNVVTVRNTSEKLVQAFDEVGAHIRLIRVNPDLPLGDSVECEPDGKLGYCVVSVMAGGLESLKRMDQAMKKSGQRPT